MMGQILRRISASCRFEQLNVVRINDNSRYSGPAQEMEHHPQLYLQKALSRKQVPSCLFISATATVLHGEAEMPFGDVDWWRCFCCTFKSHKPAIISRLCLQFTIHIWLFSRLFDGGSALRTTSSGYASTDCLRFRPSGLSLFQSLAAVLFVLMITSYSF